MMMRKITENGRHFEVTYYEYSSPPGASRRHFLLTCHDSGQSNLVPLDKPESNLYDYDADCITVAVAAGFDPEDEEIVCTRLTGDWNGHKKGSIVVTGQTTYGIPFVVVEEVMSRRGGLVQALSAGN